MPAINNIVIADAAPANHTLAPQQAAMALSLWQAAEAATYGGNTRLAVTMSPPSKTRATTRIKGTLTVPHERTVEGVVSVPDTSIYTFEAVIPSAVSAAEAADGYALFKNLVAHATVQAYVADRTAVW
jgi:hypothetical protein